MDASPIPPHIEKVSHTIQISLAKAREMARAMYAEAVGSNGGFNPKILAHMRRIDVNLQAGAPANAQAIAEFLAYSKSPVQTLFELQSKGASPVHVRSQKLSALIVSAALAEQQNADCSLRDGRTRFDASLLERTLDDWLMRGAHRPGMENSPLADMAKAIDLSSTSSAGAMEARFGCVIPVVVSIHTWACFQADPVKNATAPADHDDVGIHDHS